MAGPIRELLERAPLRTAIRKLFNRGPRSQDSKDSLESSMQSDRRGRTNLMEGPRRFGRREVEPIPLVSGAPIANVAPSPAARQAQRENATADNRAKTQQRQNELPPPPPEPIAAGVLPQPTAAPKIDQVGQLIAEQQALAKDNRFRAKEILNRTHTPLEQGQAHSLILDASRIDREILGYYERAGVRAQTQEAAGEALASDERKTAAQFPPSSIDADALAEQKTYLLMGMDTGARTVADQLRAAKGTMTAEEFAQTFADKKRAAGSTIMRKYLETNRGLYSQDPFTKQLVDFVYTSHPEDPAAQETLLTQIVADANATLNDPRAGKLVTLLMQLVTAKTPPKRNLFGF